MVLAYLSDNSNTIPNAYYESIDDAISTAYQMGLTNGATTTNLDNVSITYTVRHTHGNYCYPTRSLVLNGTRTASAGNGKNSYRTTGTCTACGQTFDSGWVESSSGSGRSVDYVYTIYGGHSCNPIRNCGLDEGTRTTSDATTLKAGDEVVSATITY